MLLVRIKYLIAMLLFASALTHCDSEQKACTTQANWSFRVHVKDAVTGFSICDATLSATEGTEVTELTCYDNAGCVCAGGFEQLGTFQVTVTKSGYQTFTTTIVVDQSDDCGHVVTKDVTINLSPQ